MARSEEMGMGLKTPSRRAANAILAAVGFFALGGCISSNAAAQAAPVKLDVLATGAVQGAFPELKAAAESALGLQIEPVFGTASGTLSDRIRSGAAFDVAILTPAVNAQFVQSGAMQKKTFVIANVDVGIGITGDRPATVDIVSRKGLQALFTGSDSVRYAPRGMGEPTFHKIVSELQLDGKIKVTAPSGPPPTGGPPSGPPPAMPDPMLPKGAYMLSVQPVSEFQPNGRTVKLGPVPRDLQVPVQIEAGISAKAAHEEAALRFVGFLQSPAAAAILEKHGFARP